MIRGTLAALARFHARQQSSPHPKFGAFDRASLLAAADLFALTNRPYALGALIGALQAKKCGYSIVRMVEFGVATGDGLRLLCNVADILARRLDLSIDLVGLDNAIGLPAPKDFRDHPEIWGTRQFEMGDAGQLRASLPANCSLIIGDIAETIRQLDGDTPIAFASIDVDFYSSTTPILDWFSAAPVANLLPATPIFFDDVFVNWTYGASSGEERAIAEFNTRNSNRKLTLKDASRQLFALDAPDHPIRTGVARPREPLEIPLRRYIVTPESLLRGPPY